jgi:hypothetical protein
MPIEKGNPMRATHTLPLAAAMLLAACGGGDADTDNDGAVSAGEVVAEAQDAIKPLPGEYQTTVDMLEFNVPGMPDSVKRQMQQQMGGAAEVNRPFTYCLTPEQARANGPEQMAKHMAQGDCTVARFDVSGGTISADMTCKGANGSTSHVVMEGQMTSTKSTMAVTDEMEIPGAGKVQIRTRATSERVGDCAA